MPVNRLSMLQMFVVKWQYSIMLIYLLLTSCFMTSSCFASNSKQLIRSRRSDNYENDLMRKNFEVHPNTIILTVESRSRGAKYINETEVLSNEECLLWCWQVKSCNVAVFEEMTKRSCFLFNCGPPADFRCKFIDHDFYTSSILKATQHSYDLAEWSNQAKQEKEVVKQPTHNAVNTTSIPVSTTVGTVSKSPASTIPTSTALHVKSQSAQRCRHHQFQCLNNSECIAIYNVCDGIPQCPDGSDESSDLQCPGEGGNGKPILSVEKVLPTQSVPEKPVVPVQKSPSEVHGEAPLTHPPPPPEVLTKPDIPHSKLIHHETHHPKQQHHITIENQLIPKDMNEGASWREGYGANPQNVDYDRPVNEGSDSVHSPFAHKHSKFMAANDIPLQYRNKFPDDYERYPQPSAGLEQQYNAYEGGYPKNQYPDYDRTVYDNYHPEDSPYWANSDHLQSTNYLTNLDYPQGNMPSQSRQLSYPSREDLYTSHHMSPPKNERNNQNEQIDKTFLRQPHLVHQVHRPKLTQPNRENYPVPGPSNVNSQPYDDMPRTEYHLIPKLQQPDIGRTEHRVAADVYDRDEAIRQSLSKQLHQARPKEPLHIPENIPITPFYISSTSLLEPVQETTSSNEATLKTTMAIQISRVPDQTLPTKDEKSHASSKSNGLMIHKLTAAELSHVRSVHTHESNNAIVALTLGLIITAMLVALVGCRLRTLRRRSSRRARNLSHDADYLVNGLYL